MNDGKQNNGPGNSIDKACDLLAVGESYDATELNNHLCEILNHELWRQGDRNFLSFGKFAVAARASGGLGIRSQSSARLLRFSLIELDCNAEWAEVIDEISRPPGHPKSNANGEDSPRFYTVSTSSNSIDRLLLTLIRRHPQILQEVRRGILSFREALIKAGLRQPSASVKKIQQGLPVTQDQLLEAACECFNAMTLLYQGWFIRRVLEPFAGEGLSKIWFDLKKTDASS
jgi:hypothetical protein